MPMRSLVVEARQIGQQEADGVAQPAIGIDIGLEYVLADAQILGEIRRRRPQAQNLRAILFRDHLRRQRIAQRLGHFAALLVQHEAVGEHALVRRAPAGAHAFQQRGLEPAAMLVGAFQIKIGLVGARPMRIDRIFHGKDMGRAGIEPDIENVLHLLVIAGLAALAQEALGLGGEPGIGAFGLEGFLDAA